MEPSSSSHVTEIKHDVFISFRGTDVRRGLLSHLKKELRRKQIDIYVDERLERGDEISSALLRAIEGSQILLVIFSKDYASSKWCLEELAKMIECMERNKQIVIPVFYNVDPSDVRHQQGDYGDALAKHEENFKENMVKVKNWRFAMKKAAQLSGFDYPSNFEGESDLVDEIVEDVLEKLSKFCPSESNGLVGIDENIAHIQSLLVMESREVRILGIWGMGGIGKTTIARVVFDKFSPQYNGCCFLENVREESNTYRLSYLREKLLSELLEEENLQINGTSKARSSFVKTRLSRKKVFVVLDDINTPEQLKYLVGEPILFGPGSRVIVTSRDKHVLTSGGVQGIHEVKELNSQESLKLFCLNAFKESQPKMGYEELSRKTVVIAKGIPLALKVLGSDFHSLSKDTWECALRRLKKYPNQKIQSVLRFSYDGLHDVEKDIFLDIAFIFKEEDKDYVIRELDSCDFYGASGIKALLDKALITISNDNRIQMHDLIQEMCLEIVRQECPKDPGRRSRLRDNDEVCDALKNQKGSDVVEVMLIDESQIGYVPSIVDTLKKMPNLRFLKICCPSHVELSIPPSHVTELLQGVQALVNLKRTGLSRSKQFMELPEFSKASYLEYANLNNCHSLLDLMNLKTVNASRSKLLMEQASNLEWVYPLECESLCDGHPFILSLQTQVASILSRFKELRSIESEIHLKYLDYLLIDGYSSPKKFSLSSKEIRQLNLTDTGMEILNSSIGHSSNLECSDIDGLQLENLPNELFCLRSTYYLRLSNGRGKDTRKPKLHILFDGLRYSRRISLNELYNSLARTFRQRYQWFSWLCALMIDGSKMLIILAIMKHLSGLEYLAFRHLTWLQFRRQLPPSILCLDFTNWTSLETVDNLKEEVKRPKALTISNSRPVLFDGLSLGCCCRLSDLPFNISVLSWVRELILDGSSVERLPASIKHISELKTLSLRGCRRLRSLPELPPSIQNLDAFDCLLLEIVVFGLTTAGSLELEYTNISFENCVNLDAEKYRHSFHQYARGLAYGYELRSTITGAQEWEEDFYISRFSFCYPQSRVPEWFLYRTRGNSIAIELSPLSDDIVSCLLCVVVSSSSCLFAIEVKCQSYLEDGNMPRYATGMHFPRLFWRELNSDHVYISYSDYYGHLLREIGVGRVNEQCTSSIYNPKVTFKFSFEVKGYSKVPNHEQDGLIKECGVCPLYLSHYHDYIKQRELGLETTEIEIEVGVGSTSEPEPFPHIRKLGYVWIDGVRWTVMK